MTTAGYLLAAVGAALLGYGVTREVERFLDRRRLLQLLARNGPDRAVPYAASQAATTYAASQAATTVQAANWLVRSADAALKD